MKKLIITAIAATISLSSPIALAKDGDKRKHKPSVDKIFEKFDKDGDGKLSKEEFKDLRAEMKKRHNSKGKGKGHKGYNDKA